MEWLRWYHGAVSDPKWPLIARKAGVSVGVVVSVWAALLEHASQYEERGSVSDFDGETFDALYGYDDGTCDNVVNAMLEKGLICDGCICSWQKRQPRRERDDNSTERVREHRNKKRQETQFSTHETPCNASETPRNAQNRTDKNREEIKTDTSYLAQSYAGASSAQDEIPLEILAEPLPEVQPVEKIPLVGGTEFCVSQELVDEFGRAYQAVDVLQELAKARAWCLTNPQNKKTARGVQRFLNNWLARAQDKAPVQNKASPTLGRCGAVGDNRTWAQRREEEVMHEFLQGA